MEIKARLELLHAEFNKAQEEVKSCQSKLERAAINCHIISGHINECTYMISSQEQKEKENGDTEVEATQEDA